MNASPRSRSRFWLAALPALLMSLWALSCGDPPSLACEDYCSGCCTTEGVCLSTAAQSATACGLAGAACSGCRDSACVEGICGGMVQEDCGQLGQDCCTAGAACSRGLTCSAGSCVAPSCGQDGQACCSGDSCNFGLSCNGGTCGAAQCGNQGQACCGGDTQCAGSLVCSGGTCQTSGTGTAAIGAACTDAGQCAGGRCLGSANYPAGYCTRNCNTQGDCPTGSVCTTDPSNAINRVCLDACSQIGAQGDCRAGYVCDRAGSHQPTDPGVCVPRCDQASSNICGGSGNTCNATTGLCAGQPGYGCGAGGGCNAGGTCTNGYCEAPPAYGTACNDGSDCVAGVCIKGTGWAGGYCSGTCKYDDTACIEEGGGCSIHTIEDGDGNPNNNPNACLATCSGLGGQGSCRAGYVCDVQWTDDAGQTSCVPACTANAQCSGVGNRCVQGLCCGQRGLTCCKSGTACDSGSCNSQGVCQ